ncbi:unnamed protein product [Parajaminaea phylloscopi]
MSAHEEDEPRNADLDEGRATTLQQAFSPTVSPTEAPDAVLTHQDAEELGRFSQGKARIDEYLRLLDSRPRIEPFAHFRPAVAALITSPGQGTPADLQSVWDALDGRVQEAEAWEEERDRIEREAAEFDVADMERLRHLAKASSERNMSPEDTDIIEVALETLVAIERLRVALSSREYSLRLLRAELSWEQTRRSCCEAFVPLILTSNELVRKQLRWSPQLYEHSSLPTSSSLDEQLNVEANVDVAKTSTSSRPEACSIGSVDTETMHRQLASEAEQIFAQASVFASMLVPASSEALDAVIEIHKAPEILLDEQDHIEDLATMIDTRTRFARELLTQWATADDLYKRTARLHHEARKVCNDVRTASASPTSAEFSREYRGIIDTLVAALDDLCGRQKAREFLDSPRKSATQLRFSPRYFLPMPRHSSWPEQAEHDGNTLAALHRELAAAAKRVRQAKEVGKVFIQARDAMHDTEKLLQDLSEVTRQIVAMPDDTAKQWDSDSDQDLAAGDHWPEARRKIFTRPLSHHPTSLQTKLKAVEKGTARLDSLVATGRGISESLTDKLRICSSAGLAVSTLRTRSGVIVGEWHDACSSARSRLKDMDDVLTLVVQFCQAEQSSKEVEAAAKRLCDQLLADVHEVCFLRSHLGLGRLPSLKDTQSELGHIEHSAETLQATFRQMSHHAVASELSTELADFRERLELITVIISDNRRLASWAGALHHQRSKVEEVHDLFTTLLECFERLHHDLDPALDAQTSIPVDDQAKTRFDERVQQHMLDVDRFKRSQEASLPSVGTAPTVKSFAGPPLPSPDEEVRQASHGWCLLLDERAEELRRKLASLLQKDRSIHDDSQTHLAQTSANGAESAEATKADQSATPHDELPEEGESKKVEPPTSETAHQADNRFDDVAVDGDTAARENSQDPVSRPSRIATHSPQQDFEQHLERVLETLTSSLTACEGEIKRRDKSFNKILRSSNSRRLPSQAFVIELSNRRMEAEDALAGRLLAIDSNKARLREVVSACDMSSEHSLRVMHAEENIDKVQRKIEDLLNRFDVAIAEERGNTPFPAASQTPIRDLHLFKQRAASSGSPRDIARGLPMTPRSLSLTTSLSSDALAEVDRLTAALSPNAIEQQTQLDGLQQALIFLDLPSVEEADAATKQSAQDGYDVEAMCIKHPSEPRMAKLSTLLKARLSNVTRLRLLADFADKASTTEASLASFLELLDSSLSRESARTTPSPSLESHAEDGPLTTLKNANLTDTSSQAVTALSSSEARQEEVRSGISALEALIEATTSSSAAVAQDLRVRRRVEQIQRSYVDMAEMAQDILLPGGKRSASVLSQATTTEGSVSAASTPLLGSMLLPDSVAFADESPLTTPSRIPLRSSVSGRRSSTDESSFQRQRTVSLTTPRRSGLAMTPSASRIPTCPRTPKSNHLRATSGDHISQATPRPTVAIKPRSRLPSIAQSPASTPPNFARATAASRSRRSVATSSSPMSTPARRVSLRGPGDEPSRLEQTPTMPPPSAHTATHRPNRYRANPKSKLDIAVGKVVNRLPMQVSMVHASKASNGGNIQGQNEWKDDSGKYWVGHPDPKLCFCRILRSRTIMVRVGGGWQELTRYLLTHYRDSLAKSTSLAFGSAPSAVANERAAKAQPLHDTTNSALASTPGTKHRAPSLSASGLPWISSSTLSQNARVSSVSSVDTVYINRTARSPSQPTTSTADISSPIVLNADGSPQEHRFSSSHLMTPTNYGRAPRTRNDSLRQRDSQSPTARFRRPRADVEQNESDAVFTTGTASLGATTAASQIGSQRAGLSSQAAVDAASRQQIFGDAGEQLQPQRYTFQLKAPDFARAKPTPTGQMTRSASLAVTAELSSQSIAGEDSAQADVEELLASPSRRSSNQRRRSSMATERERRKVSGDIVGTIPEGGLDGCRQGPAIAEQQLLPLFFRKDKAANQER